MKLIIYETTHHETLPSMLDLSGLIFKEITVFIKKTSYLELCSSEKPEEKWPSVNFIVHETGVGNRSFIKQMFAFLRERKCTHLHISTLDNNLLYMAAKLLLAGVTGGVHVSLSVQAVNEYAVYKFGSIRDISESIAKVYLHRRISSYRVFFPMMVNALQARFRNSTIVFIPSRFYVVQQTTVSKNEGAFRIVIPGTVDPIRRDYKYVIHFFQEFLSTYKAGHPLQLVILGNSDSLYGKEIISALRKMESSFFELIAYSGYISQTEYEKQLQQADILWSPLQIYTEGIRKTAETYGYSTATGLLGDLLFNTTPALIPSGFLVPDKYEDALICYQSVDELATLLMQFINDRSYIESYKSRISQAFFSFQKNNFIRSYKDLLGCSIHLPVTGS